MIKISNFGLYSYSNQDIGIIWSGIRVLILLSLLIIEVSQCALKVGDLVLLGCFTWARFGALSVLEPFILAGALILVQLALELVDFEILWVLTCACFVAVMRSRSHFVALGNQLRLKILDFVVFGRRGIFWFTPLGSLDGIHFESWIPVWLAWGVEQVAPVDLVPCISDLVLVTKFEFDAAVRVLA